MKRPYWIALMAVAGVGLLVAGLIYGCGSPATWQLNVNQGRLWEVVLKAVAGFWDVVLKAVGGLVAIIGAVITAFKYIDEKARQRDKDRAEELWQREQDRREKTKDFLKEKRAVWGRLGLSLAKIMNYDPADPPKTDKDDPEWNPAKETFYEIYWGEIPFVADEAVMEMLNRLRMPSTR